ncbi:hypothetical protein CUR178_03847 [Leishmania enriettii]|uniref:non-specific serine/threonine protein kinase n=1 Tax=Leishmania enriettii TaxID=5663 RepID=A0A836KI10_LEIEN|nr:hypothetical protein CUR178_03847 [Leishmania enriettii]
MPMGPDYVAEGSGGVQRYSHHHDMRGDASSFPRCLSPHAASSQKQLRYQTSPEGRPHQHYRTLSSSNSGSPATFTVSSSTRDGGVSPCHRASLPYRSHASPRSRLGDAASPSSTVTEAAMHAGNADLSSGCSPQFKRRTSSAPSLSPVIASRELPPLQAHSPESQHHRQLQFSSAGAADLYSSKLVFASSEAPQMKNATASFKDAVCGGSKSPNSCLGGTMTGAPQQQSRGNCRNSVGCMMLPEEESYPNKLTQTEMATSSLPVPSGSTNTARGSGPSPYQRAANGMSSPQQRRQQFMASQRHAAGNLYASFGPSASAASEGATPGSASTSGSDANTSDPRRYGESSSPAGNISLEGRLPTTSAPVAQRHSPLSSAGWPHEAFVPSSFTGGSAPSPHPYQRAAVSPPLESAPVMPPKTSPETTSTPHRACDSAAGGAAAGRVSEACGLRKSPSRQLAHHQSPEKVFIDSQSTGKPAPNAEASQQPQTLNPPAPTSSPQVLKSPAMFGVIDLSYSRADASGSRGTPTMSTGATAATANAAAKALIQASAPSRAPVALNARAPVPSLPSSSNNTSVMSANHADPAAPVSPSPSTMTTVTAATQPHDSSANSEFTARYGTTIVRMGNSAGRTASNYSTSRRTPSLSGDATTATVTTTSTTTPRYSPCADCQTPVHTSRIISQRGALFTPFSPPSANSCDSTDEPAQQQLMSAAPTIVVAARARKSTVSPSTVSVSAVRQPERSAQALMLTADTVLPVAAQEEEADNSSSATTTATRSSSNSRAQPPFLASPFRSTIASTTTAHKAGIAGAAVNGADSLDKVRAVHSAVSAGRRNAAARVSRPRDKWAATFAGGSSFAKNMATEVASASASSVDIGVLAGARGAHVRGHTRVSSASTSSASSDVLGASRTSKSFSFASSRAQMQRYIDQWRDRFEEDKNAYKEGGYLTVTPGRIVHSRYVLIQKLGWGEFSTVWLGYDTKHASLGRGLSQAFVAVKVSKCRSSVQEATRYEVSLLRYLEARLPRHAAITNIIDCFDVRGEFGTHTCMVIPLCGPNLLSIIERMKANHNRRSSDDVRMMKEIVISVLISLHELSVLNVVHTDIKPENVLCSAVDSKLVSSMEKFCSYNQDRSHMISLDRFKESMAQQTTDHLVCLADFGLSALLEPPGSAPLWASMCGNIDFSLLSPLMRCKKNFPVTRSGVMDNQRGTLIQTREYRAPEVLLGLDFTCATDVWSVGCMTFELITGSFLMDPKKKAREPRDMDIEHLAMMMQLLGPLPPEITNIRVRNNDYYDAIVQGTPVPKTGSRPPPEYLHRFVDRSGNFIYASRYRSYPRRNLEAELVPYLGFREAHLAANFILSCLHSYDPKQRPSAKKLLSHQWFHGIGAALKEKVSSHQ